ncbi:MAG: ribosome maturation factor RimP [Candidatus Rokubacteria bacterium]|nr:ribosome maturation factor RimP [Candidatus Rokubacteria bacterium]
MSVGSATQPVVAGIEALAAPVLASHGLTLVDVELAGGGRGSLLRFYIDKPGGVTIDDCQRFSREIGDLLDVEDLLPGSFDLEVSSPGLDRELKKDRELAWAVGRDVRAWTREPVDGRLEFVGRLLEIGEAFLTLAEAAGRRQVPRALLTKVRLEAERKRSA